MSRFSQPDRANAQQPQDGLAVDVLIADVDTRFGAWLDESLSRSGHRVTLVSCGTTALARLKTGEHDIALVDRELSGIDGLGVVRQARADGINAPIIMSGELGRIRDRVEALDTGADDYLVKPYAISELIARLRSSVMRDLRNARSRTEANSSANILQMNGYQLDILKKEFGDEEDRVRLQQREVQFLSLLMQENGGIVTRERFYEHILAEDQDRSTNVVDTHISRIRRKLSGLKRPVQILSVRGQGYKLRLSTRAKMAIA